MQARFRAILITTFLLILIACEKKEKELVEIPFETKPFIIKIGADGINSHFKYFMTFENGQNILHYYDYMYKRVTLINFDTKEIIGQMPLNDAKYKVKGLGQMAVTDSSYIIRNLSSFHWMDFSGTIYDYKDTRTFKGMSTEQVQYRVTEIENSNSDQITHHLISSKANYEKGYLQDLKLAKFNFQDKVVEFISTDILGPQYVNEQETFAGYSNPDLLSANNNIIVHYSFTADFQVIDVEKYESNNVYHNEFKALVPDMQPITFGAEKRLRNTLFIKELHEQTSYYPIIYDKFRDLYFRPYRLERDLEFEDNADFSLNLLVYDANFTLQGYLNLGKTYMPYMYITDKAVYIRKKYSVNLILRWMN